MHDRPDEAIPPRGPSADDERGALVDAIHARDALLLAVAHDLRASTTAIAESVALLRASGQEPTAPRAETLLRLIDDGVRDIRTVIDNLLDAERFQHGIVEPVRSPTPLLPLVRDAVAAAGLLGAAELDVDDAVVHIDAGISERILWNLLDNAGAHSPAGTPITICARDEGSHVLIHVDDTGPGIPDERKEEVFEPFHPSSASTGAGIGLYLVRQFARLHGGDAWVADVEGGGTSIRVRLAC